MAKATELFDDFNDNSISATKWVVVGPAPVAEHIRETNQRIEIRPRPFQTASANWFLRSATPYDLTDSEMRVELVQALSGLLNTHSFLTVGNDSSSDRVSIAIGAGMVNCSQYIGGFDSQLAQVPYDPQKHRWLRIRHRSNTLNGPTGTLFWEVSPDGVEWTTLASNGPQLDLTTAKAVVGAGTSGAVADPGFAVFDNFNVAHASPRVRRVEERRLSARDVRVEAAELAAERLHLEQMNNNDEVNYPGRPFVGNYSKSLKHDALGDPDPFTYGTLLRALESRDTADFEEIVLASPTAVKLTNPQAGLAFDIEGPDAQEVTIPPAPRFDSQQTAHEMGELYWMALARDVPFINYDTSPRIAAAVSSLNSEFPAFGGTVPVTVQNVFRGIYPGEQVGPYVSQFLVKGNVDTRKPAGQGRDAADGFISYGARTIDQRLFPAVWDVDYLTDFSWWLDVQNGVDKRGMDQFDTTKRFIRTLRDGATFVHFDQVIDAYYNAAWILMSEPMGNQLAPPVARPQIDLEFPKNQGNPYDPPGTTMDSRTQVGFATFGQTHMLQVLSEVLGRALRSVWWQKWSVHRRLRPEEYGGRVHNQILFNQSSGTQGRTYPLESSIVTSLQGGALAPFFGDPNDRFPHSYLLPQAYPEGAPTHPAYGAGHATGSGACVTILKAFFDERAPIENPLQSSADGLTLVPYAGADAAQMTVGGELNKLAGNVALFRNAAGVHWRSDYTYSLQLGEAVAIRLLQEMSLGFNEKDGFFRLTRFDGRTIQIEDGRVIEL
jgi:hypothetical protein